MLDLAEGKIGQGSPLAGNRAFKYGDGIFETFLVYEGRPLHFNQHVKRLFRGAEILGLNCERMQWVAAIMAGLKALRPEVDVPWARCRVQVWREGGGTYLPHTDTADGCMELIELEGDPWIGKDGVRLGIYPEPLLAPTLLSGIKTCSALPYILASRWAAAKGYDDALICSVDGGIAEATASNVFLLQEGILVTPWLASGCLKGTVRQRVMEAARLMGMGVEERRVDLKEVEEAECVFLTNAVSGLRLARGAWEGLGQLRTMCREKLD